MHFLLAVNRLTRAGFLSYCQTLSEGLRAEGHRTTFFFHKTKESDEILSECGGSFTNCISVERGCRTARSHIKNIAQKIGDIRPDVLVLNCTPFIQEALPYLPWGIKRITVVHNTSEREVVGCLRNHFWWDRALCVSPLIKRVAEGEPGAKRLFVCPLGIVSEQFSVQRKQIGDGPLSLIWLGRVEVAQKRADLIAPIAKKLVELGVRFRWTIVGSGSYMTTLRDTLEVDGTLSFFNFAGSVPREEVSLLFPESDVLVLPSDHEGLPQALLETMAGGVVPVASRIPGSTDYVVQNEEHGFLCERGVPVAFAGAIRRLYEDRHLLASMSNKAKTRIDESFTKRHFARLFLSEVEMVQEEGIIRVTPRPIQELDKRVLSAQCPSLSRVAINKLLSSILPRSS
jgi:glycosyltransferase involved in cell wall biosynthesis